MFCNSTIGSCRIYVCATFCMSGGHLAEGNEVCGWNGTDSHVK